MFPGFNRISFGGPLTPMVRRLMIINGAVFLVQFISGLTGCGDSSVMNTFGLSHAGLVQNHRIWQLFTYMFIHGGFLHILFNLFALWMFAGELEKMWGSRRFLKYYLSCGVGAGLFIALMNWYVFRTTGFSHSVTIGASGAIYGILLAYGMTWPDRKVLLYFLFPVKMKYLVIIFGLLEFFGTFSDQGTGISHVGHLGGLISGFLILFLYRYRHGSISRKFDPFRKLRLAKKKREIQERIKAKQTIDRLLGKISSEGFSSLSGKERQELEKARKIFYAGDETVH